MNMQIFKTGVNSNTLISVDMDSIAVIENPSAIGYVKHEDYWNKMNYIKLNDKNNNKKSDLEFFAVQAMMVTREGYKFCACATMNRGELLKSFHAIRPIILDNIIDEFTDAEAMFIFMRYKDGTLKTPFTSNLERLREAVKKEDE